MAEFFIGIDDTDAGESIGTGALARELQLSLAHRLAAVPRGITRHQLLVHPDIPYTSHNSAACLFVECAQPEETVAAACGAFLRFLFHPGADPGLCVVPGGEAPRALLDFGPRAAREVLQKEEARALAAALGIHLEDIGGSGLGIIGALAACSLRLSGNDGRFLSLPGLREIDGEITVGALLEATPIERVLDEAGRTLDRSAVIATGGWVRPELRGGRIVLTAAREGDRYMLRRERGGDY